MGKLKLECLQRKLKAKKLAAAVYKTLKQKINIKAEIVFDTADEIHELNREQRGVDSVTDVLSFPSIDGIRGEVLEKENCKTEMDGRYVFIGSIVLCDEKIKSQAEEYGHSEDRERDYLIIHGLLHLFGYDHMTDDDKKQMRDLEKEVLSILGEEDV